MLILVLVGLVLVLVLVLACPDLINITVHSPCHWIRFYQAFV